MPFQARLLDMHICTVPPGFPSPILTLPPINVMVNGMPAARAMMTDMAMTGPVPPATPPMPHSFPIGSKTVFINNKMALRMGDTCDKGGPVILGSFNVITGG
ncbi:PAAR domain-containing protein [Pseudooceanicola sp. C21-150M6]|uniref:PAAR domain-containing protein n=1 Tax=Pseudooceanicola sp. C21-150M6 TaxID=3434355 RepID=UPI003D7FAE2E